MPRGKLNEAHVKQTAVEWLANSYYRNSLDSQAIVSGVEAWVSKNSRFGNGRADGLIAAQLQDGSIYTISIEAKSSRTWKAINVQHLYSKMFFHAFILAVLVTFVLLILGVITAQLPGIVLPIIGITVAGFCLINFSHLRIYYRSAEVVEQAQRYPANEKWIALSADIYNKLVDENQVSHFERICQKKGIGLIRVTSSTKSKVIIPPKSNPTPKKLDSFLDCYSRREIVRNNIALVLNAPYIATEPLLLNEPARANIELAPEEIAESVLASESDLESVGDETIA